MEAVTTGIVKTHMGSFLLAKLASYKFTTMCLFAYNAGKLII
jgi:hypothetical protein